MGTNLHAQDLSVDDYGGPQFETCNEHLLITRPDAVEKVHAGFLEVGCDEIETDSFNGTSIVLNEFGIGHMAYDLNVRAARLARRVASDFSTAERPRWVAGSMGPGTKLPTLGHVTFIETRDAYGEQARGLLDGGAQLLIVETCQDLLQLKAALMGIFREFKRRGSRVPVIAQVTIEQQGTMLLGTEIGAALTAVEPFPIDVFGMNCATGPQQMAENVRYLCQNSKFPVSVIPNAWIPENIGGYAVFKETPESLSKELAHFARDLGVNVVGGCCGTTPAHLKAVVEAVKDITPVRRAVPRTRASSSIFIQQPYRQDTSFLIIGERVKASGSNHNCDLSYWGDFGGSG